MKFSKKYSDVYLKEGILGLIIQTYGKSATRTGSMRRRVDKILLCERWIFGYVARRAKKYK